jgi:hypothetical protein
LVVVNTPATLNGFAANSSTGAAGTVAYFSYRDAFGKGVTSPTTNLPVPGVYAYFSAYKKTNGYNRYIGYNFGSIGTGVSDNYSLVTSPTTISVWPYAQSLSPVSYLNPNSFQIICAGPDAYFGSGTTPNGPTWTPTNASTMGPLGADDLSNFYDKPLGTGQ